MRNKISAAVIIIRRRNNYTRGGGCRKKFFDFFEKICRKLSHSAENTLFHILIHALHTLIHWLHILIHALTILIHWLGFRLHILIHAISDSAPCITYLNTWTRLHILIHCRLVSAAPSAKIEYYVTRVVSQSESSMEKTHQLRQPIRIEYYVSGVVSQSESSIR